MASLSERIRLEAETIEMLSGERPVGIRLTRDQLEQVSREMGVGPVRQGKCVIYGLRVEIIDD